MVEGYKQRVRGTVLLVLADTPAAHQLGGFKISPGSAFKKCRDCDATLDSMNCKVRLIIYCMMHHSQLHFWLIRWF